MENLKIGEIKLLHGETDGKSSRNRVRKERKVK